MESYSVQAVLSVADQGFTTKMNAAAKSLDQIDSGATQSKRSLLDIAKGAGAFKVVDMAVNKVKSSVDGAIKRFDTLNQYPKVMQQIGFSAEDAQKSMDQLSTGIDGLPTSLDSIVSSTQGIAVLTRDLDGATKTSIALNDAFLASGAATADAERGLTQYVQMLSKGSVDLQSWRTLQETMGPALYDVAEAFGYAGESAQNDLYAALQSGQITFTQFNNKLIELDSGVNGFAERARTASAGIGTSFQNLNTAVVRGMEKVIRSADNSLTEAGLPNFQQQLESTKTGVNTAFTVASEEVGKFVKIAAPGVKLVTNNLDTLIPVLGTATGGFVAYKAAIAIDDKVKRLNTVWKEGKERLQAMRSVMDLQTAAVKSQEAATIAATRAHELSTKASVAQKKAEEAQTAAKTLATKAAKAQEKADIAQAKASAASSTSTELSAEAAKLKSIAESTNAAATKASEDAERKAAIAAQYQAQANKAAAMSVNAETIAQEANTAAETVGARAAEASNVAIAVKTAAVGVLSGEISLATAAQLIWNAAMEANPIGAVVATIAVCVAGIVALVKIISKLNKKMQDEKKRREELVDAIDEHTEAIDSNKDSRKAELEDIKATTSANKKLIDQIVELSQKERKTAEDKAKLQGLVETLNGSMDDLNLSYSEEKDQLNMTSEALQEKADAYARLDEASVAQENLTNVLKDQAQVEADLQDAVNATTEAEKKKQEALSNGEAYAEYDKTMKEMGEKQTELKGKLEELEAEEQKYSEIVASSQAAASQATSDNTQQQKISLDSLSDAQQATVDRISDAYQTMTDSLGSLNDKIEEDNDTTWSSVQKNQADTIAKTQEFADLYSQAINAGVSESYLNAIGATGPEALPLLRDMMNSGVDEVLAAQDQWEQAYDSIGHTFIDSMQLSDTDKATLRDYIKGESGVLGTMAQALDEADFTMFSELGTNVVDSFSDEISNSPKPALAGAGLAATTADSTAKGLETGSPSRVYKGLGQDTIDGFIIGIESKQKMLDSTMTKIISNFGKTSADAAKRSISTLPQIYTSAFQKVNTATSTAMQRNRTITQTGMTAMANVTKTGFNAMQSTANQGSTAFSTAVTRGMNSAKSQVTSNVNAMERTVKSLESKFKTSGYNAALGLANGINNGSGKAIAAANRLANTVSKTINDALKIHSPSRVTEKSGEFTTEGMAEGMLNKIRQVREAAKRVAQEAIPTGYIDRMAASAGAFQVDTSYSYAGDINARYYFEIPVVIDGREAAKATATYTQEELEKRNKLNKYMRGYR